jgi:2-oxo-3-hexenedioate decarboxylase
MLANMLARKGERVRKGDVILTGGITAAVKLNYGDIVTGKFDGFGEVSFTVTE